VQLKQSSVGALLQSAQSGSFADVDGGGVVSCQFVALMKVYPQLEGGLQQPDCHQNIKGKKKPKPKTRLSVSFGLYLWVCKNKMLWKKSLKTHE
jgi:hypothetical protein